MRKLVYAMLTRFNVSIFARTPWRTPSVLALVHHRAVSSKQTQLPPRPQLPEDSFTEVFLKGSGPGGQAINKTNSAVQLTHTATGLVVKCQQTRSRETNRKVARRLLSERVDAMKASKEGRSTRLEVQAERARKKKASAAKKKRRKYRSLSEEAVADSNSSSLQNDQCTMASDFPKDEPAEDFQKPADRTVYNPR